MIDRRGAAFLPVLAMAAWTAFAPQGALGQDRTLNRPHDHDRERIFVDIESRWLWLIAGSDTLLSAPVAVGKGGNYWVEDHSHNFETPRGRRAVLGKQESPLWTPPDWHYYEKAERRGFEVVPLENGERVQLSDGTYLEVRDNEVGRINRWGNWWPFTPGSELVYDGKIFMPPLASPQRKIPQVLGAAKLDLGDGILIHGTHRYNWESIGSAASHGCIRVEEEPLLRLYDHVDISTPVIIT